MPRRPADAYEEPTDEQHWDDFTGDKDGLEFFTGRIAAALRHCRADVPVYQWHATRRQALVEQAWRTNGLLVHQTLVWANPHGTFGRSHFRWSPELCFYGWPEGIEELEAFEFSVTDAGSVRMSAPGGHHDDCVVGLALAA